MDYNPVDLRCQIGYVFQGIGLFPHRTIEQNVEIVPRLPGWSIGSRQERMQELLDLVGLPAENFAERFPDERISSVVNAAAGLYVTRYFSSDQYHYLLYNTRMEFQISDTIENR